LSRYRPPAKPSTALITAEGFDRSENAEYIYRKKELREIDRRIRYLQKRLSVLKVVRERPSDEEKIFFGAWVTLIDEADTESRVRIVGPDEIDTARKWISVDSVMARALLKKSEGDEITVRAPGGETVYCVEAISYNE